MVESDEEQVEVLKNWWDENGTSLIVTLVLVLGGTFGYRAWENSVIETGEAASDAYQNLITAITNISSPDDEAMQQTARTFGETLKTEHEGTAYAVFASMQLAKLAVDGGNLDTARAELEWALGKVEEPHVEAVIRTRLARILIAQGDPTAAIARLINYKPADAQLATYEEVMGDAYVQLGDMSNARQAYQRAIEHLGDIDKPVLELKLADIPVEAGGVAVVEETTEDAPIEADAEEQDEEIDALATEIQR